MTPQQHIRVLRTPPLYGISILVVGFALLGLLKVRDAIPYFVVTAVAMIVVVAVWAVTRSAREANCPHCGQPMKLKPGRTTLIYQCGSCSAIVDSGHKYPPDVG